MNKKSHIVSIGGVGGSGTRVVSQILKESGYFTGSDLNDSEDNLLFTLIFKRQNILTTSEDEFKQLVDIFTKLMATNTPLTENEYTIVSDLAAEERTLHTKKWLQERVDNIKQGSKNIHWGWKEPNTHIVIERLLRHLQNLKFVYVHRNGLDMAYSKNQNQLKLWGSIFFNTYNVTINPRNSLKYWCIVHRKILALQEKYPEQIIMLDFDELCQNPHAVLKDFFTFIQHNGNIEELSKLIKKPSSIGRYKQFPLTEFYQDDLNFINKFYKIKV